MNQDCEGEWKDVGIEKIVENPGEWLKDSKVIVAGELTEY